MTTKVKEYRFKAVLEDAGNGAFISFPYDVKKEFGKLRIPVKCSFDGEPYRGTLLKYGTPTHVVLVLKAIREKIKKQAGDVVDVWLIEDKEERKVEVPEDFKKLLKKNKLEDKFLKFSYTHQREWMQYVNGAKKDETRIRRMEQTIAQLKEKA